MKDLTRSGKVAIMRWLRLRKGDESLAYKIPALQGRNTNRWICKDLLRGLLGSGSLSKMREGGGGRGVGQERLSYQCLAERQHAFRREAYLLRFKSPFRIWETSYCDSSHLIFQHMILMLSVSPQ